MRVGFARKTNGPKNLMAEAELFFDADTKLHGMKLVGFTIWAGQHGTFCTFPARSTGTQSERRYFDYLRSADPMGSEEGKEHFYRVKNWIVEEYKRWVSEHPEEASQVEAADEEFS